MNTARRMRVRVDELGAARYRPSVGRVGIVAVVVLCAAMYVLALLIFGGR